MSSQIVLPDGFGYVPASIVSLGWVLAWQTILVGRARKRANIEYPQLYAEQAQANASLAAMQFNCTQRAHQNTLEAAPVVSIATLVLGLKFPRAAAIMCGLFVAGRILFTLGYSTGKPANRMAGAIIANQTAIVLLGSATYAAYLLWP